MNVCFNGCSFTVGEGFTKSQRDQYIYDRLLEQKFKFNRINIAKGGSSNHTIFMRSADAILSEQYHCVVTQWSALNRIWLKPGPDCEFFSNDSLPFFKYREIYLDEKAKNTFKKTLLMLNGDFDNIIQLIKYCKILESLAYYTNTEVVFVNGLVPWTNDLITKLGPDLGKSLSSYSKSMLDFDNREDNEIIKFFQELQQHFSTLNRDLWVNLFESFVGNSTDVGPEGHHPGIISHKWMADKISNFLLTKRIL